MRFRWGLRRLWSDRHSQVRGTALPSELTRISSMQRTATKLFYQLTTALRAIQHTHHRTALTQNKELAAIGCSRWSWLKKTIFTSKASVRGPGSESVQENVINSKFFTNAKDNKRKRQESTINAKDDAMCKRRNLSNSEELLSPFVNIATTTNPRP